VTRLFKRPLRVTKAQRLVFKALIHVVILGYIGILLLLAIQDQLGADPVKALLHQTGVASIIVLLISLTVTPAARLLPCGDLIKFRRLLGLYAFFIAFVHISTYVIFDIQLDLALVLEDILKRPYISVGFAAFVILFSLAVTSPVRIRQAMKQHWQTLHNGVYLALILALLHFSWSVKTVLQDPLIYWFIGGILLCYRLYHARKRSLRAGSKTGGSFL